MGRGTLEIEAVAGFENVVFLLAQPDLKLAAQDVEKFLALVNVSFAAAPAGFDAEEVRLHGGIAPGEEFHADAGRGFEDFTVLGANEVLGLAVGIN